MNASPLKAAEAVDAGMSAEVRTRAVKALSTEFVRRISEVSFGRSVCGVEEIEFRDRVDRATADYIKARQSGEDGRRYLGITAGMDEIQSHSGEIDAGQQQAA